MLAVIGSFELIVSQTAHGACLQFRDGRVVQHRTESAGGENVNILCMYKVRINSSDRVLIDNPGNSTFVYVGNRDHRTMFNQTFCQIRPGCANPLDGDPQPTQVIGPVKVVGHCTYTIESTQGSEVGRIEAIRVFACTGKDVFALLGHYIRIFGTDTNIYGDPNTLIPMLKKGQIDFALVDVFQTQNQYFGSHDIYHFLPVAEEEIILACSKEYYEKSVKKDHSFKHLTLQNFITYRQDAQVIKSWFKHHFGKSNTQLQTVLTVYSHQAIISTIQHHVGMGIVASHLVSNEIKRGRIIGIKTSKPEIRNQISLTQLQDKIPTLTEKIFEKYLLKEIKRMGLQVNKIAR